MNTRGGRGPLAFFDYQVKVFPPPQFCPRGRLPLKIQPADVFDLVPQSVQNRAVACEKTAGSHEVNTRTRFILTDKKLLKVSKSSSIP